MFDAMCTLFGYGHPQARFWAIGLEEHCGGDADIHTRLETRQEPRFQQAFIDRVDFHTAIEIQPQIEDVSVWRLAVALYQALYGQVTDPGRADPATSDLVLAEILPLPRPSHNVWPAPYLNFFANDVTYRAATLPAMSRRVVDFVQVHKPQVVVLHGKVSHNRWVRDNPFTAAIPWRRIGLYQPSVLGDRPFRLPSAHIASVNGTVWVRTDNLVENGRVSWPAWKLAILSAHIKSLL